VDGSLRRTYVRAVALDVLGRRRRDELAPLGVEALE
jgi:hypothetical protein